MTTIDTPERINAFRAATLKAGLKLYARTGMKPNRAWTLSAMLKAATEYTGEKYPRSKKGAMLAHDDLARRLETVAGVSHYYASTICTWVTGTEKKDCLDRLFKNAGRGMAYALWRVPGPADSAYEIKFYAPQIDGAEIIARGTTPEG